MSQASIHYCMSIHNDVGCKRTKRKISTLTAIECIILWKWPVFSASSREVAVIFIGCNFHLKVKTMADVGWHQHLKQKWLPTLPFNSSEFFFFSFKKIAIRFKPSFALSPLESMVLQRERLRSGFRPDSWSSLTCHLLLPVSARKGCHWTRFVFNNTCYTRQGQIVPERVVKTCSWGFYWCMV